MLRQLSDCVGEILTLPDGTRKGDYTGVLTIDRTTNPETYLLKGETGGLNLGSLTPNPFNTAHRVNEQNAIVGAEEAAA